MSIQRCCPEATVYEGNLGAEAVAFKAVADPARLTILATLARAADEVCVCDFTAGLGLNQSTVSHHLKILKEAGLIDSVRRGTWGYYSLRPGVRERLTTALERVIPTRVAA
jgi:ArsR family transcriptional regulator